MATYNSRFTSKVASGIPVVQLVDYLSTRFTYKSRVEWSGLIANGRVYINGSVAIEKSPLCGGEEIAFDVVDHEEVEIPSETCILGETEELVAVHKPAGVPVHRTGKIVFNTLANWARQRVNDERLFPLHRLDRETSGLVVFQKSGSNINWSPEVCVREGGGWGKTYLALTSPGNIPDSGEINLPLGESNESDVRCQMFPMEGGKPALTRYRVLKRDLNYNFLLVEPVTGRKHQIRAHLAALGFPIIGDKIYSHSGNYFLKRLREKLSDNDIAALGATHHLLHCLSVGLNRGRGRVAYFVDDKLDTEWQRYVGPEVLREVIVSVGLKEQRSIAPASILM